MRRGGGQKINTQNLWTNSAYRGGRGKTTQSINFVDVVYGSAQRYYPACMSLLCSSVAYYSNSLAVAEYAGVRLNFGIQYQVAKAAQSSCLHGVCDRGRDRSLRYVI